MAWKAEVKTYGNGFGFRYPDEQSLRTTSWTSNALAFATEDEAIGYAKDLMSRWMAVTDYRVAECQDEVTHHYTAQEGAQRLPVAPKHGEFNG